MAFDDGSSSTNVESIPAVVVDSDDSPMAELAVLRARRERALVHAAEEPPSPSAMERTLVAEKKAIALENRVLQLEAELRDAKAQVARFKATGSAGISVGTQTRAGGDTGLPSNDYATYKRFVKRVYAKFNPESDPQEFLQRWVGKESAAVAQLLQTYSLSPAAVLELSRPAPPTNGHRSKSPHRASVTRGVSISPPPHTTRPSTSKQRHSPPSRGKSPPPPPPPSVRESPTPHHKSLKISPGATVLLKDPFAVGHRGVYLGKDEGRGLCCVQLFGHQVVSRFSPVDVVVEKGGGGGSKRSVQHVFPLRRVPPAVGDRVQVTHPEGGPDPVQGSVLAYNNGQCLVSFARRRSSISPSDRPLIPASGKRWTAPGTDLPSPERSPPPEDASEVLKECFFLEEDVVVVRYSSTSSGPQPKLGNVGLNTSIYTNTY